MDQKPVGKSAVACCASLAVTCVDIALRLPCVSWAVKSKAAALTQSFA